MPQKNDGYGAALAAGLVVGGTLLLASSAKRTRDEQRESFRRQLERHLKERGYDLLAATVGRDRENTAVWQVNVRGPGGIAGHRVLVPASVSPYDERVFSHILQQIA